MGVTLNKEVKGPEGCSPLQQLDKPNRRGSTAKGLGQPDPLRPVLGRGGARKASQGSVDRGPLLHPQHMSVDPGLSWI